MKAVPEEKEMRRVVQDVLRALNALSVLQKSREAGWYREEADSSHTQHTVHGYFCVQKSAGRKMSAGMGRCVSRKTGSVMWKSAD